MFQVNVVFLLFSISLSSGFLLSSNSNVAFQAYGHVGQKDNKLTFQSIHLNAGDGFDVTTGVFTAPVAGSYLFMVQLELLGKESAQNVYVHIFQSGKIISSGYVETDSQIDDAQASTSAITNLSQGEKVWVALSLSGGGSGSTTIHSDPKIHNSHFSGTLLSRQ